MRYINLAIIVQDQTRRHQMHQVAFMMKRTKLGKKVIYSLRKLDFKRQTIYLFGTIIIRIL